MVGLVVECNDCDVVFEGDGAAALRGAKPPLSKTLSDLTLPTIAEDDLEDGKSAKEPVCAGLANGEILEESACGIWP